MLIEHVHLPGTQVLVATVLKYAPLDLDQVKTEFVTDRSQSIQVGVLHRQAGTSVEAHQHLPAEKTVYGCQEVLIIKSGQVQVDIYGPDENKSWIGSRTLLSGDIYIQYCGGHAFHFLTNVQFIEIKQGPYTPADKVFFNPLAHEQTR